MSESTYKFYVGTRSMHACYVGTSVNEAAEALCELSRTQDATPYCCLNSRGIDHYARISCIGRRDPVSSYVAAIESLVDFVSRCALRDRVDMASRALREKLEDLEAEAREHKERMLSSEQRKREIVEAVRDGQWHRLHGVITDELIEHLSNEEPTDRMSMIA